MICDNISINNNGVLTFAGQDVTELAQKYGTPLYLLDEEKIREKCQTYVNAMRENFGEKYAVLYASKANSFKKIYNIVESEGMCVDVVSIGEIYTALKAGYPLERAYFHSNNKTDFDVEFAIDNGVGHFVVDNREELEVIDRYAAKKGIKQKILLRLTPGIDTHTYEAVNTGKVDSKFGTAIETGQAEEIVKYTLGFKNIDLCGFHCHIGSMVFDSDTFLRGAEIMLQFMAKMKKDFAFDTKELNLGGGYGVRYTENDPTIDIAENIAQVADFIKSNCNELGLDLPIILMEPGRSIVADAGMTLYTVGTVKRITGYKNYVSVDGGMSDNPRYALYESEYTLFNAAKANAEATLKCDVVGRCCESGDIIQPDVLLPETERGDILAVCTTGAYNFSMAMNYNRIARPPIVMLNKGDSYVAVRRESLDDIIRNDI
ncbi:MAG: diaminopimelate decarboxylase [Acutalibacteraceae bacterium]|nr:diaminopimelate decarboxylase [Acutalibacteraceae bacterium]